ncbi:fumarate reductase cytochrome b subunit [Desulfobacter sp.]|uniref:fumarate reductase cytochrome b subunit n=1 Tax=Desulfobacter sp. TaxID=2294 RepID=UPI003D0D5114
MESYRIESNKKKSRLPARLDFLQSATGLVLGLFVWVHIGLDASIIMGPDAFNWVSKNMELAFLSDTGHGYPIAVFFAVFVVFTLFIIHALLGMRKFPNSWKQHRIMKDQMAMMKHQDTNLWYIQVLTGFMMIFAGSVHLYTMLTHPGSIDPDLCAGRVVSDHMWFVYLVLLVCAALHGNIGLYRLCMKWGWFQGADYHRGRKVRAKLKNLRNKLIIVYLSVGLLALLVFVIYGLRHKDGEPDQPAYATQAHEAGPAAMDDVPEEAPETESVQEQPASLIEETLPHDNAPAVQESEPAHEEAADDQGDVRKEAAGDDEATHQEAGPSESEAHGAQEDALHIEGGHGPQETL